MSRRAYAKGERLFLEGDPGDTVHVIQRGKVAVETATRHGDVVILAVLAKGMTFGEQALIDPAARRTATVVALEPTETRVLHRADFDELRVRHPAVERFLVDLLAAQVRRLSRQVVEGLYVNAEQRVIRRLAELAGLYAEGATEVRVLVPIRQEDLASLAGTTRPTTNRVLRLLEAEGLVTLGRGRTVVLDLEALRRRGR